MTQQDDEKILMRWKTTNQLSHYTYKNYKSVIDHYTKCCNMTISELYHEAIEEEEQGIPRYRRQIRNHLLDYHNYLDNLPIKETTRNMHINVIRSFYKHIDIDIPQIINRYNQTPIPQDNNKNITKDIIKIMIDTASTRDKAILSYAAMTGQSPDEIRHLTIQQLVNCYNTELEEKVFNADDIITHQQQILELDAPRLDMHRQKTMTDYWVYLPRETSRHIIQYLKERQDGNNKKLRITDNNTPLFITKHGKPFSRSAVGKLFSDLGRRCGFENPTNFDDDTRLLLERHGGEHRVWRAYNFRKYFINTCRRHAGTTEGSPFILTGLELADFWVGHKVKGSIQHYIQYNDDDIDYMQQQYLQVLPYLSLEYDVQELTTRDKKEFLELKEQYESLIDEVELLKKYIESKAFVEEMQKQMKGDEDG